MARPHGGHDRGELARLVIKYRKRRGMTQAQLSEAAGLSPSMVGHLEAGATKVPSSTTIYLLAKALNVSPTILLKACVQRREERP